MKLYAYLLLGLLVCSILIQPLLEIALVCKDRIEVGSAITNSVRAAKKECYTYYSMRDLNAEADREVFIDTFSQIFAKSLGLRQKFSNGNEIAFESTDNRFNDFKINCSFIKTYYGNKEQTNIVVKSESEYKFKTKYLRQAQDVIRRNSGVYKLEHIRRYSLKMSN